MAHSQLCRHSWQDAVNKQKLKAGVAAGAVCEATVLAADNLYFKELSFISVVLIEKMKNTILFLAP